MFCKIIHNITSTETVNICKYRGQKGSFIRDIYIDYGSITWVGKSLAVKTSKTNNSHNIKCRLVDFLFNVTPIVGVVLCFVVRYFMSILVLEHLYGEERAGCFA